MLKSADELFVLDNTIKTDVELGVLSIGIGVSATIISAQCAELLLKFKIQQEGKKIEQTHKLYKLFKTLSDEAQTEIKNKFEELKSTFTVSLPNGWNDAESVLNKANDAFVFWRYVAQVKTPPSKPTTIQPYPLYIVALSIYETTPIAYRQFSKKEVTDPEIKERIFGRSTDK